MDLLLLQDVLQMADRFQWDASQFKNANARRMQMITLTEYAIQLSGSQHEDWRGTGSVGVSNMKDQPIS